VFIAYAGPNAAHARELYQALVEKLGKDRVFFDREQPPGTNWYREVQTAQVDSRLTAAVLAREPDGGWFDKDEFVLAIDEVRRGDHVLIPVFADGVPDRVADWPYGLEVLTALDAQGRGGMSSVAAAISERLNELPASGVPGPPRPRTRRELLEAALHLDRSDQWGAIQRIAHSDDPAYFLLYGQTFQNLRLFLERILHRLNKEVRPHRVLELEYRLDGADPTNVWEWDLRLAAALRRRLPVAGGRVEELMAAASAQPLFLVLELPWTQPFDAPHRAALRDFLERRLPELAGTDGGCTRLLVATEYVERDQSRHREIEAWMRAGAVRYEPMAEVETPGRADVVAFLKRCGPHPPRRGHPAVGFRAGRRRPEAPRLRPFRPRRARLAGAGPLPGRARGDSATGSPAVARDRRRRAGVVGLGGGGGAGPRGRLGSARAFPLRAR
ncbi:MAG: toll/interleukin-1 receptor domain-containing protein, partial [Thermoanaerobaculia bacterium]